MKRFAMFAILNSLLVLVIPRAFALAHTIALVQETTNQQQNCTQMLKWSLKARRLTLGLTLGIFLVDFVQDCF